MPESSTNVELKGKKDNLKRRNAASTAEDIEANVEVVDGAVGAKTDLQELTASLKQGFAQMSHDLLLMRSKRMRYKMPFVSCFPCRISAWKFMLAYIYMTVTLRGAGGRALFNTLNSC